MFQATMCPSSGEITVSMRHWYLVFCVDDCLVCRLSSTQNNKYQVSHKNRCFSWWWAHSRLKHVEINKYTKNKLCTNLPLFIRLYRDARSTKHKISLCNVGTQLPSVGVMAQIGGPHLISLFLRKVTVQSVWEGILPFIHFRIFCLSLLWLNNSKSWF